MKIGFIVGSLRKGSVSKKIAETLKSLFPAGHELEFIEIGNLPIYNEDLDNGNLALPETYTTFRNKMKTVDAIVFVTPEYNRSVPAALKNALDVGSRPYGASVWGGKPALVVSQSPSNLSGFGANHHLRQTLVFLDVYPLQQPEVYLANSFGLFDEKGKMNNEGTLKFLQSVVDAFLVHAKRFK
ncbi:MAG: NAD(P)H-dependent oxidoreductase [Acholeplasmataceae bacterium]|nr:NAD(P)H-dependent oxidoreductase [Acholeplasmataceae bacterium]